MPIISKIAVLYKRFSEVGVSENQSADEQTVARFIFSFYPAIFLLFVVLIIINLVHGEILSAFYFLILFLFISGMDYYIYATKKLGSVRFFITLAALVLALSMMFEGGLLGYGFLWITLFPVVSYTLNGMKRGGFWIMFSIAILAIIMLLDYLNIIYLPVDINGLFEISAVFLFATAFDSFRQYSVEGSFSNLEESNLELEKFKLAVDNASEHIIITNPDAHILFANKAASVITGYSNSEMIGKTPALWGKHMPKEFYEHMWKVIKTDKQTFTGEITNKRKNGESYQAISNISPILDSGRNIQYFVGIERDVSKERLAEQNNERLAAIVRDTQDAVFSKDLNEIILSWNQGSTDMFGFTEKEAIGKSVRDLIIPKNISQEPVGFTEKIKKDERIVNRQTQRIRKDGSLFDASVTISPIHLVGRIVGSSVITRNISKEKQIDKMKTEFVSLSSHQLRTPLTAIKWGLELFTGDDGNLTDKQRDDLKDIYSSTERMIDLVNSLLNVSRMESGRIIVNPIPTNIVKLANDVVAKLKIEIAKKNISLIMDVGDGLPEINLDYSLIFNVYQNLITNSVSYSPPGGKITVSIKSTDGEIISSIKDEGIGIPENEKAHLYEKFYRASNAKIVRPDGSGLGLYIVKSIVESSGGKIWFESEVGKGTTFYFSLPVAGMMAKDGQVTLS